MPAGSRHIQSSTSLTLEFETTPTYYLHKPVLEIMLHFAWPFLDPPFIILLCVEAPVMSCYGKLRAKAISLTAADIHRICTPLDHRASTSSICSLQMRDVAKILLLCNFRPGGIIRCLGVIYMSDVLDFVSINTYLLDLSDISISQGNLHIISLCCNTYSTSTSPSKLHSEALEGTCYSITATTIIVPPTPTSTVFTRSYPPESRNPSPSLFPAGHSALSAEFSCGLRLHHTHTQGKVQRDTGDLSL